MQRFILTILLTASITIIALEASYTVTTLAQTRVTGYAQYSHKINLKQGLD